MGAAQADAPEHVSGDRTRELSSDDDEPVGDAFAEFFRRVLETAPAGADALALRIALLREPLEELPEARRLVEAIEARPDLSLRFPGRNAFGLDNLVLAPALARYEELHGALAADDQAIEALASEFVAALREETTPIVLVAPLLNVDCELERINIIDGLEVSPMITEERQRLLSGYGGPALGTNIVPVLTARWAVRMRTAFSDVLDLRPGDEAARCFTTALRLAQTTNATVAAVWAEPERLALSFAGGTSIRRPGGPSPFADPATVDAGNVDEVVRLTRLCMEEPRRDRRLELALRRFDTAIDRHDYEDQIIDLWIALEALLLPDDRAELSYRASLRLAQAVGRDASDRVKVFELARQSYNTRSKIVHGDQENDVRQVAADLREVTQRLLRLWIDPTTRPDVGQLDRQIFEQRS